MAQYNLFFQGKIVDGASLEKVKGNISRLFKTNDAKTTILFSGKKILLKRNLDEKSIKKYIALINKAGAIAEAVEIETPAETSTSTNHEKTKSSEASNSPEVADSSETSGGLSAGLASLVNYNKITTSHEDHTDEEAPGLQLAPLGAYMMNINNQLHNFDLPDIDHLSMSAAETGSLEEYAPSIEAIELPDIDNLSMSAANTGTLEEFSIKKEPIELPDISELDITEQSDIPLSSDSSKETPAEIPDTSDLSICEETPDGVIDETIVFEHEGYTTPDISHLKVEEKEDVKKTSGKAHFQID